MPFIRKLSAGSVALSGPLASPAHDLLTALALRVPMNLPSAAYPDARNAHATHRKREFHHFCTTALWSPQAKTCEFRRKCGTNPSSHTSVLPTRPGLHVCRFWEVANPFGSGCRLPARAKSHSIQLTSTFATDREPKLRPQLIQHVIQSRHRRVLRRQLLCFGPGRPACVPPWVRA